MRVLVYVEGPSDRAGMEKLFAAVIAQGRGQGVGISFLAAGGNTGGKARILDTVPMKAAKYLREHPSDWVLAAPDLYPMHTYGGTPNAHTSARELRALLEERFARAAGKHQVPEEARSHFRAFCFQHDVEALVLAAPEVLKRRLGTTDHIERQWRKPVETQNDDQPPKRIVEALFRKYRKKSKYIDTTDLPWIPERAELRAIERVCPRELAPFAELLRQLAAPGGVEPDTAP